jgi:hypothetical protein
VTAVLSESRQKLIGETQPGSSSNSKDVGVDDFSIFETLSEFRKMEDANKEWNCGIIEH